MWVNVDWPARSFSSERKFVPSVKSEMEMWVGFGKLRNKCAMTEFRNMNGNYDLTAWHHGN